MGCSEDYRFLDSKSPENIPSPLGAGSRAQPRSVLPEDTGTHVRPRAIFGSFSIPPASPHVGACVSGYPSFEFRSRTPRGAHSLKIAYEFQLCLGECVNQGFGAALLFGKFSSIWESDLNLMVNWVGSSLNFTWPHTEE